MIYIVKRGDTLAKIAAMHGISISMILQNNMICNPNLIFIDQPIYIPIMESIMAKSVEVLTM